MNIELRNSIVEEIKVIAEEQDLELAEDFGDDSVLLETGLDSLGFAILVASLEDKLGYDPFAMMEEPVYPSTLREFVAVYDQFKDHQVV